MEVVSIGRLVEELKAVKDSDLTPSGIYELLSKFEVDVASLEKYLHWSSNFYTRNLVFKDERFEVLVICWESGQASTVHDHWEQKCWMMVPIGKLRGQNFAVVEKDESRNYCRLTETNSFDLADCIAAKVDLEEPIHQVFNLAEFGRRAASIHIYSKPYDRCLSYCRETDTYKEVQLFYTSVDGVLCDGVKL